MPIPDQAVSVRLVDALQRALRDGPVKQDALMTALEQFGQREADLGAIWQTCHEHGLADLVGDQWVPRGWGPPAASTIGPRRDQRASFRVRRPDADGLAPAARRKITELRTELGLTRPPEQPSVPVPHRWADVVREAVGGLADELSAVTQKRTQTDVPLRGGHLVATGATRALVRYEADVEVSAREGTDATLVVAPGEAIPVEVISVFGAVVTLAVPIDTPTAATARLRCDLSWLLSSQNRRLNELAGGAAGFDAAAALAVVTPAGQPARSITGGGRWGALNRSQSLAVDSGLREGITWLWGPPGTGKTTTVSVLLEQLRAEGRRTLLTAPTNTAVDIALQSALARQKGTTAGNVVRVGQPADTRLVGRPGGPVLVEEIAEQRGEPAAAELMRVTDKIRRLRTQLIRQDTTGRDAVEVELADLQVFARALTKLFADVRRQVCQDAHLVAATTHQLLMPTLSGMTFDVVVIDETSMLPASLTMIAAGAGHGHTVVAGDFRQLPPVVIADTSRAKKWLRRSAFDASGVTGLVARRQPPPNLVALTEQHRMPPALADAISDGFYPESRLRTAETVHSRRSPLGLRAWHRSSAWTPVHYGHAWRDATA